MTTEDKKIIFDFGANRGQNVAYYLERADVVIAVEANLELCKEIRSHFQDEIKEGRLFVENFVLTDTNSDSGTQVDFFIHNKNSVLSQFKKPDLEEDFTARKVFQISPTELVNRFTMGKFAPYYVKIDLEGFDAQVIRNLFLNKIYPVYISAESHSIEVFAAIVESCQYDRFKLVDGSKVPKKSWQSLDGKLIPFKSHSAGPFGSDIDGAWLGSNAFFKYLSYENLGWKDIHCSRNQEPYEDTLHFSYLWKRELWLLLHRVYQELVPHSLRRYISRFVYLTESIFRSS
jgi:FkbM family methyltransferase